MGSFMSRYLDGLVTDEEIKKHGLTKADLLYMKREFLALENMLEQYQSTIFDKRNQGKIIKKELEDASKMANLLSFLGKSFSDFIGDVQRNINKVDNTHTYLETNLSNYRYKTIRFIIYLLYRQQQDYALSKFYYHDYYSDVERRTIVEDDISLMTVKSENVKQFHIYSRCEEYLNSLYERRKSFIVTSPMIYDYCDPFRDYFYKDNGVLFNSDEVAFLGSLGGKTLCFLGDDVFKETIAKLMLFNELHGLCIGDINNENRDDYARAIESMDVSAYSMEKNYNQKFYMLKKER